MWVAGGRSQFLTMWASAYISEYPHDMASGFSQSGWSKREGQKPHLATIPWGPALGAPGSVFSVGPKGQAGPFSPGSPSELVLQIQKPQGDILPKLPGHPPTPAMLAVYRAPHGPRVTLVKDTSQRGQATLAWPQRPGPSLPTQPDLPLRPQARLLQP